MTLLVSLFQSLDLRECNMIKEVPLILWLQPCVLIR